MAVVTMRQLLESGAHFGHQTKRWNPKMKRFIFTERNGIYIIDLTQTLGYIDRAYDFVKETVAHGGTIMFIGTKRQAQESIVEQAGRVGMPYVTERWLGGMLTNFQTVYKRLQRLKELELIEQTGGQTVLTKKEALVLDRERKKLERTLGGIREMTRTPSAVWIVDTNKEHLAVNEARKLGIPVVAILDTNCDPDLVDYKVPGNDDAIRSIQVLTRVIADAVAEGLMARAGAQANAGSDEKPSFDAAPTGQLASDEPLPAWETDLLTGGAAETAGVTAPVEGAGAAEAAAAPEGAATEAPAAPEADAALEVAAATSPVATPSPPDAAGSSPAAPSTPIETTREDMANVTAADIKKLREATGAGMTDCKVALVDSDGDYDKAIEFLRIKGLKGVAKREGRAASNGLVAAVLDGTTRGTMLELNCETDFVAKGEKFQALAAQVLTAAQGSNDIGAVVVEGKPLKDVLDDAGAMLGEKIEVRRVVTFDGGTDGYVGLYLHKTNPDLPPQLAVLVELSGSNPGVAKDLAQHIAAFSPTYVTREEVPDEVVAKERSIAEATAKEEGKPEAALPKIVEGRVNGFFKEAVLLEQAFAKDNKKTVAKVLSEAGVEVKGFARFKVGQA